MIDHRPHNSHPERPERLISVLRHLDRTGQLADADQAEVRPATDEELLLVHSPRHIDAMNHVSSSGGGQVEADTWLSTGSEAAARVAAGAVVDAVNAVVNQQSPHAFCLVRPPGHHARSDHPMGFCLYNSVAIGAAHAVERLGLNRVLIVDWDVHHGNGTQEVFYDDPRVAFYSIHRHPFYPGSGDRDETGSSRGRGSTKNVPIKFGTARQEYLAAFRCSLESFADEMKPELILLSAGFDAHVLDPVGNLGLEAEDFDEMTQVVLNLAANTGRHVVSVLEGGYNTSILAGCVADHLLMLKNDRSTQTTE